ncbi:MAG: hypothetical protein IJ123_02955 [Blautia sp.]|nr:hypothetical protein [Blautia sp.]
MRKRFLSLFISGALIFQGTVPVTAVSAAELSDTADVTASAFTGTAQMDDASVDLSAPEPVADGIVAEDTDASGYTADAFEPENQDIETGLYTAEDDLVYPEHSSSELSEGEFLNEEESLIYEDSDPLIPDDEFTEETLEDITVSADEAPAAETDIVLSDESDEEVPDKDNADIQEEAQDDEDLLTAESDDTSPVEKASALAASAAASLTAHFTMADGDIHMAGYSQMTRNYVSERLRTYIKANGEVDEEGTYALTWQETVDGNEVVWEICYSQARNEFLFYQTTWVDIDEDTFTVQLYVTLPYGREDIVKSGYHIDKYDTTTTYVDAEIDFSNPDGYRGTEQLPVTFNKLLPEAGSSSVVSKNINTFLQAAFKKWNDLLLIYPHVALTTLGFDAYRYVHTHDYHESLVKKASIGIDGQYQTTCSTCGNIKSTRRINKIQSVALNVNQFFFNNAVQKPLAVVKDSAGKAISSQYYDLVYSNSQSKYVGTYYVTVKFKDIYTGTKSLQYKIVTVTSGGVAQPKLVAAYNGVKGIGVVFYKVTGANYYVIYRKYKGAWSPIRTISATSSEFTAMSSGRLMYTDTSVKENYGEGYIYSVAAKKGSSTSTYDAKGVAIYRLNPPADPKAVLVTDGTVSVQWGAVPCHGYEVQYTLAEGTLDWKKCPQTKNVHQLLSGFASGHRYAFRIRCFKTNAARGTYYSEYSKIVYLNI